MNLKLKLNEYKEHFGKTARDLKGVSFSDASRIYKTILARLPDLSHLKNIVLFSGIGTLFIFILFAQRFAALSDYLPKVPISGGTYSEGTIGRIEQLNPLFSPTNSAEQMTASLIYSGLTKKDNNRGSVPDLAERWEISPDGKTYTFFLKKDLRWQDGAILNADDIIFTISAIQNPDTRSSLLEVWKGIETTKADDNTVIFKLISPYSAFLSNTDVLIVPKHILANVSPKSFITAEFGTKPIGSGPYSFKSLKTVKDTMEVTLVTNKYYYGKQPYISEVSIKTYPDYAKLTYAYTRREVQGISRIPVSELKKKSELPNIETYNLVIPTFDAMYFNLRTGISKEKSFREAVSYAINRDMIIRDVYDGRALPLYSAILPGYPGYNAKLKKTTDIVGAKNKLISDGFVMGTDGILAKGELRASARLVIQDDFQKVQTAEIIQKDCAAAGIEILVEKYPAGTFYQDYVRPRNFDIVLVSQNMGADSDLYAFWHSTNNTDPGLNLSGYSDRKFDKFIEQARTAVDMNVRNEKYTAVATIISEETTAVYLVWPDYVYGLSKEIKGFVTGRFTEPKDHFWNITDWYVNDKIAK